MERRTFLKTVGGASGALALGGDTLLGGDAPVAEVERVAGLPRRVLGRTGRKVSVVGFPGLSLIHHEQAECTAGLRSAIDRGVNYFDVAPAYGNGQCETKMGLGLEGVPRDSFFLACKTKKRDKAGAREELEKSLKLLKTDHFDLYQFHHLRRTEEVEQILGPGGALETFQKAKEEGKVKYFGFSAHTEKAALAVMKGFRFDTAMFPIDFVELLKHGWGKDVLALAKEQGVAVQAIKAMSRGLWPKDVERTRKWWYRAVEEPEEVDLAVRFVLSQTPVVTIFSPAFLDLMGKAIEAAKNFRPLTPAEVDRLTQIAKTCESVFQKEEQQAKWHRAPAGRLFADSPYECPCDHWA